MDDQKRGVALRARTIPFPTSISAEARSALERMVREDGVPLNSLHVMPAPEDYDGWMRIKMAAGGRKGTCRKPALHRRDHRDR